MTSHPSILEKLSERVMARAARPMFMSGLRTITMAKQTTKVRPVPMNASRDRSHSDATYHRQVEKSGKSGGVGV